ncbi:hypothetical protein ACIZ62_16725 [Acetobacterium carbinolicum]|jgi:hypothetical protein|uniref:hypothetical protein n=1 Tax=Acetobacterium TaxID=33951 RepID=UPI000DBEBCF0|nr:MULTISPECIES: hypothetical protein [unclassified Acetobacterium]AWW27659.1 hypothetical protein DOZ58_14045 [Acetobacterium sp. KB-1]MDK2940742.1 hypothetical protein [Acetobacterium sp.]MDZ5724194.1 hypothetical protein [Acetobacterium sp. K1/6]
MKKNKLAPSLLAITIILVSVLFMGASCSATTAKVSNAVMTTSVDDNSMPTDTVTEFPVNTDVYVAAELHNAPDDTNITFIWFFEGQEVDSVTINNGDVSDAPLWGILPAELVTKPGYYGVEIYIDDREDPDTKTEFTVK